jgi:plasmid stabilization system protein ParE
MKLRFTPEALQHIAGIQFYIEAHSQQAAKRAAQKIYAAADMLSSFPEIGHIGMVPGTYELVVPKLPYILVHQLDSEKNEIIIIAVFHGAQGRA